MIKSSFFLFGAILLLGAGCASVTPPPATPRQTPLSEPAVTSSAREATKSDNSYVPPVGADTTSGVETPGRRRLLSATSPDGLVWTKTNEIISDQANVPDLLVAGDGTLYLYFSGWTVGTKNNAMGVAVSKDQGASWAFYNVTFYGSRTMEHSGDPDIVQLPDGTFRLYSTSGLPGGKGTAIYYSEGTDGMNFVTKGIAFQSDPPALDSNTYLAGELWRMVTLSGQTMRSYDATSPDGTSFALASTTQYAVNGDPVVMSNVIEADGGYRMYAFTQRNIRSFFSRDGISWDAEDGIRLELDASSGLESEYVKDPAVARLADGTHLMVYVTQIP